MTSYTDTAIITTTIQAVLSGVYFGTFLICLRWLIYVGDGWTTRKDMGWPMLIVTILIFAFSVTDLALSLESTLLILQGKKASLFTGVIIFVIEALSATVIGSVLIYRCWVVHQKSLFILVLPILLLLYNISNVAVIAYWTSTSLTALSKVQSTRINRVREDFYIYIFIINIYATLAIVFQRRNQTIIIFQNLRNNSTFQRRLRFVIAVIAESGLLYTVTSVLPVCSVFIRKSPADPPILLVIATAINSPVAGIACNLVLIRAAQCSVGDKIELPHVSALQFISRVGNPMAEDIVVEDRRTDEEQGICQADGQLPRSIV